MFAVFVVCCFVALSQGMMHTELQWIMQSEGLSCSQCGSEGGTLFGSFVCSNDTSTLPPQRTASKNVRPPLFVSTTRVARGGMLKNVAPPIIQPSWNDGHFRFPDPLPPDVAAIIRIVTVTLSGRFNCDLKCTEGAFFSLALNDVQLAGGNFPIFDNSTCGCHCGNCGFPLTYSTGYQSHGWTAYNRGQENDLHLFIAPFVFHPVVCLSYVNVTMSWDLDDALAVAFRPSMGPVSGSTRIEVSGFNFDSEGEYECVFGDVVEVVVPGQYMAPDKLLCVTPEWIGRDGHGRFSNTTGPVSVPFSVKISDTVVSNFSVSDFVFYQQPVVLSLSPASGDVEGGNNVSIIGTGFFQSPDLMCRFGVEPPRSAQLVSDTELLCNAPPWAWGQLPEVPVEVSENGVDYTRDGVQYTYTNAPVLGGWQLWQIILLIAGSAVGAGMIIAVLAICCYKRARQKDLSRRYMDSDTEGETEPLIASINSKSMRRVLSSVTRVSIEDLRIDRRIGRGSFGEVFHAFWNGTEIAVKKLPKHMLSNQKFLEDFAQEISIMAQLRHPNVIQFLGVAVDKASLYMLTEFMPRGSLYDVLHDREQNLPAELLVAMLLDTARGMSYLHTRLIHRDLKSHNLLVDQHWHVKICDFGLSRLFEPHLNTLTACGTPCWTAPEVLRNERYTEKADVYSYGIVIWECLTRTDPFAGMPPFHVVFAVGTQGARPEVPKDGNWPTELLDLMQSCWQESPDLRPSFAEIVPVLTGLLHGDDDVRGSGKGTPAKGKGAGGGNTAASTPSKQAADEAKTPVPTPSSNNNNSNNSNNKNNSNNDNSKSNNNSTAIN